MKIKVQYITTYEIDTDKLEKDWEEVIAEGGCHNYEKPTNSQEWIDYLYELDNREYLDYICDEKIIDTY